MILRKIKYLFPLVAGLFAFFISTKVLSAVSDFETEIQDASVKYGVDVNLIRSIMKQESGGRQYNEDGSVLTSSYEGCVENNSCALGVMQVIPTTAIQMGFTEEQIRTNPALNIEAGTKYLKWLSQQSYIGDDITLIAAAYNAGPGNVQSYNGVPPFQETLKYVQNVASTYGGLTGSVVDTSNLPAQTNMGSPTVSFATSTPSVYASNIQPIISRFNNAVGISGQNTLKNFFFYLIVVLGLLFSGIQILLLWKEAIARGDNNRFDNLYGATLYSSRSFLAVMVLINLVDITT